MEILLLLAAVIHGALVLMYEGKGDSMMLANWIKMRGRVQRAFALVCISVLLLAACDGGSPPTPTPVVGGAVSTLGVAAVPVESEAMSLPSGQPVVALEGGVNLDITDLEATPEATEVETETLIFEESGNEKINRAVAAGAIDENTALIYKLKNAFAPEEVPAQFRGNVSDAMLHQSSFLMADLIERYDTLPADLKSEADKLLGRPTEQGSFWNQKAGLTAETSNEFEFIDAGDNIRLWYMLDGSDDEVSADVAQRIADEIVSSNMWDVEKEIMLGRVPCSDGDLRNDNGGDGRLDMYLMPEGSLFPRPSLGGPGEFQAAGLTIPQARGKNGCPYITYILLKTEMEFDYLRTTVPHELFHSFQFSYAQKVSEAYWWWGEASATWAEDQVLPELNEEWTMLRPGGWASHNGPVGPLDKFDEGGYAQYGAYIWPWFLTHGAEEVSPTLIGEIYQASEKLTPMRVMSGNENWDAQFKQFALWNWNKWPARFYSDQGKAIQPLTQRAASIKVKSDGSAAKADVQLEHSSIRYYAVDLGSSAGQIGQLRFDLSQIAGKKGAGIQAIIVSGTEDEPEGNLEDWSVLDERNLCFRQDAPPTQIVLVVTNSQVGNAKLSGNIGVEARSEWCPAEVPTPESTVSPIVLPGLR